MSVELGKTGFLVRNGELADAAAIARIYNQGIEERVATFETEPRAEADIHVWFGRGLPVVVLECDGEVKAYAAAFPYSLRCAYATVVEFSVYVERESRGHGFGKLVLEGLVDACRKTGIHKLTSRVFVENLASRALMKSVGFREVGVYEKHGKLDGVWRDCVGVELLIRENL